MNQEKSMMQNLSLTVSLLEANRVCSILKWVKVACKMSLEEEKIIDSFLYKVRSEKKLNDS